MNIKSIAIILLGEARGGWLWMTTCRDARRVKREARAETAEHMRETLEEMRAQRDEAEALVRNAYRERAGALEEAVRHRDAAADAAQNLSAAEAVIADMRREWVPRDAIEAALDEVKAGTAPTLAARVRLLAAARDEAHRIAEALRGGLRATGDVLDELRAGLELVRRCIGTSPATDGIERIRTLLGAREGETLVAAAERVMTDAKANAERLAQFDGYFLDRVRDL